MLMASSSKQHPQAILQIAQSFDILHACGWAPELSKFLEEKHACQPKGCGENDWWHRHCKYANVGSHLIRQSIFALKGQCRELRRDMKLSSRYRQGE